MEKINKNNIREIYPLTPLQEGILFHYLQNPRGENYHEQLSLTISGVIDLYAFEQAWNRVVAVNEMLRTVIRWEKTVKPVQLVLKKHQISPVYYDFTAKDNEEKKNSLQEVLVKDRKNTFDLRKVPFRVTLCRLEENENVMIISNHHILYDGWSNGILLNEFFTVYEDVKKEEPIITGTTSQPPKVPKQATAPEPKTSFKEFIKWRQTRDKHDHEIFWRNYLQGYETPADQWLTGTGTGRETGKTGTGYFHLDLDKEHSNKIEDFVKAKKITLASFLYGGWGILLQKYNRTADVVFGTTVAGRSVKINGIEEMVGLFINTIPLRIQTRPGETVRDLLEGIERNTRAREQYEQTPLVEIKEYSQIGSRAELFNTLVILENYPLHRRLMRQNSASSLTVRSYNLVESTHYDLTLSITTVESIELHASYNSDAFSRETIAGLMNHYRQILEHIMETPGQPVSAVEMVTEAEKHKILYDFNRTARKNPTEKTISQLFIEREERNPDQTAIVSISTPGTETEPLTLTYRELHNLSHSLASHLKKKGAAPEMIIAIMIERSLEMVIGILGILEAGAAYLPIDPTYPQERIDYMLADSGACVWVTSAEEIARRNGKYERIANSRLSIVNCQRESIVGNRLACSENPVSCNPRQSLAYILYTSGTTGKPKGVMVQQASVVNALSALQERYPLDKTGVYLLKTPVIFDVSVTELFGWYMGEEGGSLAILPAEEEKNPHGILEAIARAGITHINFVPSMFNLFLETINPQNIKKLSTLRYIFLAGEALLPNVVNRFKTLETEIFLENIYGPTEATIYATWYSLSEWNGTGIIPIGKPLPNVKAYILDMDDQIQGIGVPGELCTAGEGVARGYLNNPELTAEKFLFGYNRSYMSYLSHNSKKLYRTGDLARWHWDGNIEFLGRKDRQVKIRGIRIELGEIENCLSTYDKIHEAVVLAKEIGREETQLCAYIVTKEEPGATLDVDKIREHLSKTLPGYMIPSYFKPLTQMPLTPTGKINREALPAPEIQENKHVTPPRDEIEKKLAAIWAEALGIDDKTQTRIGIDDHFFHIGGHSLKAVGLMGRIHKEFKIEIPLAELFKRLTIRQISAYIATMKKTEPGINRSLEPVEEKEYYPLSSAQKRLYILQQIDKNNIVYNMPEVMDLEGEVEKDKIEESFRQLIARHEILRTSIELFKGEPIQRIHDHVEFKIENVKNLHTEEKDYKPDEHKGTGHCPVRNHISNFLRPFELSRAPLFRLALLKTGNRNFTLLVDMHHIISDGVTVELLVNEFKAYYEGKPLPPIKLRYKDYVEIQRRYKNTEPMVKQGQYWHDEFRGLENDEIPRPEIPTDFTRPPIQTYEGRQIAFTINAGQTRDLKQLAHEEEATLYMILLSVFFVFLSKITGSETLVVGTPASGRTQPGLEHIMGIFINTLGIRGNPSGHKTVKQFLNEVNRKTAAAIENQDYPFEELLEELALPGDKGRHPLFDTVFALQDAKNEEIDVPGLKLRHRDIETGTAKFDLMLLAKERNEEMRLTFEYSTRLFKSSTIDRFIDYFREVVVKILENPDKKLRDLEIIPAAEKNKILFEFNDTATVYPGEKTLDELFIHQVEKSPDHMAAVEIRKIHEKRTGRQPRFLTYNELNDRSDRRAQRLREKGVQPDTIVALKEKGTLEMLICILGILKAGGAYMPVDPDNPPERIDYTLKDSGAKIVEPDGKAIGTEYDPESEEIVGNRQACTENHAVRNPQSVTHCFNLAYILFTSGTTGRPKGVMVTHRNVIRLVKNTTFITFRENDRLMQTGAFEFDAATFEIWGTLLNGMPLYLVDKQAILAPHTLGQLIKQHAISIIWMTSPLFNQVVQGGEESLAGLRCLLVGGDVLSPEHIRQMQRRYPGITLINGYGPTENTTFSTTYTITKDYKTRIPIGKPISNSTAYIIGKYGQLQPVGIVGELWVGGDGVARGYMNNPELTAEKFLFGYYRSYMSYMSHSSKKLYRTGDLARWQPEGIIEFLGRQDKQVKIRGHRIELEEIETRLLKHERVKEAVLLVKEQSPTDKYLCAYIAADNSALTAAELREFLSGQIPTYMIPSFFILLERIPLTPNGKVDRRALPEPETGALSSGYTAPRDEIEEKLVKLWADILGIAEEHIGTETDFFEIGGHSLKATQLVGQIYKIFNVEIPLADIFTTPVIRGIARYIREAVPGRYAAIEPTEKKEYYPLSSAQKRLYIIQQMVDKETATVYNMTEVFDVRGDIDKKKFHETFTRLIDRHESLRTSFDMVGEKPVQRIRPHVAFEIEWDEINRREPLFQESGKSRYEPIIKKFIRPFDLTRPPLLRVGLIKLGKRESILMVDMHHIIGDGTSVEILVKDFITLYNGEEIPRVKLQYRDYAYWQLTVKTRHTLEQQREYWQKQFEGEIPVLELPTDYIRPATRDFAGRTVDITIPGEVFEAVKNTGKREGTTLFMTLLAAINIFLSKISGQEDIVIGTPAAGRGHGDLVNIIGMFVNTLALRNFPHGEKTGREFLKEVKENSLKAFENQEIQYEDLVDTLGVNREVGRNPLFDVAFSLQTAKIDEIELPDLKLKTRAIDTGNSKFDLTLYALEAKKGLSLRWEYSTQLFNEESIRRYAQYFQRVLSWLVEKPEETIARVEIISPAEKEQVLINFNRKEKENPGDKSLHGLFEEQARKTPRYIAVTGQTQSTGTRASITYNELNEKSQLFAAVLKEKDVQPGAIVGLMVERSLEMITAILGILKAGGAYLPIKPGSPGERTDYMLADSGAAILLTGSYVTNFLSPRAYNNSPQGTSIHPHQPPSPVTSLAYIIYTSGSTGTPKGVPITHANVTPLLHWGIHNLGLGNTDRVLQNLPFYFDWSVWEIFVTLSTGACLFNVPDEILLDPANCVEIIASAGITALHITPTQYRYLVETGRSTQSLNYLFIGAEKLTVDLVENSYPLLNSYCRVFNMYGPTEAAIISSVLEIHREEYHVFKQIYSVPIGKPVANAHLLVLDKYGNLCPVNIIGELYISGDGIAPGYLNKPELTAERFITTLNKSYLSDASHISYRSQKLYRTGDLVRRLYDGNLEFLGRIDHQVKIRGLRIELGEIENQLLTHEAIKEAVVIDYEKKGEKYLCAYIVPAQGNRNIDSNEIKHHLSLRLPHNMHPTCFIPLEKIPMNPNGKVDRKALPEPALEATAAYAGPTNEIETQLQQIWSEILGKDSTQAKDTGISIDANFFETGGHSLTATLLTSRIHKTLDVKIPLLEIFRKPTIRGQAKYIKYINETGKAAAGRYLSIKPVEKKEYYPLSSAQKRLYLLHRLEPLGIGYNMPAIMSLKGDVILNRMEETFKRLIRRHESLRTSFLEIQEQPVQYIHDQVEFKIEYIDRLQPEGEEFNPDEHVGTGQGPIHKVISNFLRPFDLSRAPLLRTGFIDCPGSGHIFIIDMHHIISDGTSLGLLIKEFKALYEGETPPQNPIDYKDYALWQRLQKETGNMKHQGNYWYKEFLDDIPVLEIPTDFPRPPLRSLEGNALRLEIESEETAKLRGMVLEEKTTLFMVFLSTLNIMLSRLSGQEDIVIGVPIAGRKTTETQSIIGMFVNTLAVRNYPVGEKTIRYFLQEVKNKTLAAYANQEYQFEELVEKLPVKRETSRHPLFDIVLEMQNIDIPALSVRDFQMQPYPFHSGISKFDMVIHCEEKEGKLLLTVDYSGKLFKEETISRYMSYFKRIIAHGIVDRETRIGEIEILGQKEKRDILADLNEQPSGETPLKTLHQVFLETVKKNPDHVALVSTAYPKSEQSEPLLIQTPPQTLTYRELDIQSTRLANRLSGEGVSPGAIAALMVEPSPEMIIGILGILKAGGAYLPIDPTYPRERIEYMLADSGAIVLVTPGEGIEKKDEINERIVNSPLSIVNCQPESIVGNRLACSENFPIPITTHSPAIRNPQLATSPFNLAYIIYTSGTTGKPKGCLVEHRNVMGLMVTGEKLFAYNKNDVWTMFHSYCFDFSVWEMYGALLYGGKLVLIPRMTARDPITYLTILRKQGVTILNQTPTVFNQLIREEIQSPPKELQIRCVIFGGEALKPGKLKPWRDKYPETRLINMYGITETTVHVTFKEITAKEIETDISNIGTPLPTLIGRIVNRHFQVQPRNVPGELVVGGHGVARGYLNRPELTAERFISDINKSSTSYMSYSSKKLYKSGDLVKLNETGEMEYLGRIDHQVKIRGNRVETAEIERQMLQLENLEEVLVMAREDEQGNTYLCAYIKPAPGKEPTTTGLREALSRKMPGYMIPSYFITLPEFPTTSTGKVDRGKLPHPEGLRPDLEMAYTPPETELARSIAAIWREVLKIDKVGIHDNFFDLGGNSLDLVRLNHRLKSLLNREISIVTFFENPTIHTFTHFLHVTRENHPQTGAVAPTAESIEPKTIDRSEKIKKGKDMMKGRKQRIR